jgi:hypothetical protein
MHVPRLGGGFGGKCVTSVHPASGAALGALCTGRYGEYMLSLINKLDNFGDLYSATYVKHVLVQSLVRPVIFLRNYGFL